MASSMDAVEAQRPCLAAWEMAPCLLQRLNIAVRHDEGMMREPAWMANEIADAPASIVHLRWRQFKHADTTFLAMLLFLLSLAVRELSRKRDRSHRRIHHFQLFCFAPRGADGRDVAMRI